MGWPSLSLGKWEEVEGKRAGTFAMQLSAYFTAGGCGFSKVPSSIVKLVLSFCGLDIYNHKLFIIHLELSNLANKTNGAGFPPPISSSCHICTLLLLLR